jgi:hypothetical protein
MTKLFKRIRTTCLCGDAAMNVDQDSGNVTCWWPTYLIVASPIRTLAASTQPVMPPPDLLPFFWIFARRRPKDRLWCLLERRRVWYVHRWGRKPEWARRRKKGCPTRRRRPLARTRRQLSLLHLCVPKRGGRRRVRRRPHRHRRARDRGEQGRGCVRALGGVHKGVF